MDVCDSNHVVFFWELACYVHFSVTYWKPRNICQGKQPVATELETL